MMLACFGLVASISGQAIAQVPAEGLIGYWKGDHNALDSSPVGNHGTFGGSYVDGGPFGHASFNLSNTQVRIPHHPAYAFQQSTGWTVGIWFNNNGMPVNPGTEVFLGQDNGSGYRPKWFIDYGYSVYHPTNSFLLHLNDYNQERIFLESDPVVPFPTGWNQLTVVIDNGAGVVSFYLNASPIGTAGLSNYVLQTQAQLVFGFAESGLGYYGLLNNVTIYNRALSAQE
ncbi:MAG: LamG-like jellyroll fold domain-containing protein, partial [Planctomycetota bacterium]